MKRKIGKTIGRLLRAWTCWRQHRMLIAWWRFRYPQKWPVGVIERQEFDCKQLVRCRTYSSILKLSWKWVSATTSSHDQNRESHLLEAHQCLWMTAPCFHLASRLRLWRCRIYKSESDVDNIENTSLLKKLDLGKLIRLKEKNTDWAG